MALLTLNRRSVSRLAQHIDEGAVTSVGCGQGQLEALLSMFVDTVVGVDSGGIDDLCPTAQQTVTFVAVRSGGADDRGVRKRARVPHDHALLFCFPIASIPFRKYVERYRGNTIVVIADESCTPGPSVTVPGFRLVVSEVFPAPGTQPLMRVFKRVVS